MQITIVTSCIGYGHYLAEWADSILKQTSPPSAIAILTHGRHEDKVQASREARRLSAAGLKVTHEHEPSRLDLGVARNRAVALSRTEWVMHLDADDQLMPHALADAARLAPAADVVALGYERSGDLHTGPSNRRKTYRTTVGLQALASVSPASGVSPFRRSFWEQRPYRTDMDGGWDTALWLGFAHLGARFIPTKRPCFWYRQHADSVFNTRRLLGWEAQRVGHQLQARRRNDTGVSIVVPRASDNGGPRDRAWAWLRRRLEAHHPTWQITEGYANGHAWRKGEAIGRALEKATGEILVVADSDCLVPAGALEHAVALVRGGAAWAIPHVLVYRLSQAQTDQRLARDPAADEDPPSQGLDRDPYMGYAGGGLFVLPRWAYQATGGIPTRFLGWGGEDEAYAAVLDTLVGKPARLSHPLTHLWHPPQHARTERSLVRVNRMLVGQYQAARTNPYAMWSLVRPGSNPHLSAATPGDFTSASRHPTLARKALMQAGAKAATRETRPMDPFAARRLARLTPQEDPMAGARDITRESLRIRREQADRNRDAVVEKEQARIAAFGSAKAGPGPTEDKQDTRRRPNKAVSGGSGVTISKSSSTKASLKGLPFASIAARTAAEEAGLDVADFKGDPTNPRGYSIDDVRAATEAKRQ